METITFNPAAKEGFIPRTFIRTTYSIEELDRISVDPHVTQDQLDDDAWRLGDEREFGGRSWSTEDIKAVLEAEKGSLINFRFTGITTYYDNRILSRDKGNEMLASVIAFHFEPARDELPPPIGHGELDSLTVALVAGVSEIEIAKIDMLVTEEEGLVSQVDWIPIEDAEKFKPILPPVSICSDDRVEFLTAEEFLADPLMWLIISQEDLKEAFRMHKAA